jgi:hypothetical protein
MTRVDGILGGGGGGVVIVIVVDAMVWRGGEGLGVAVELGGLA